MPPPPQPSDSECLDAFVRGRDEAAFRALVERYTPLVYGVVLRRVRSPDLAADVSQKVFLIFFRKAASLDARRGLGGWFHTVARREAGAFLRREITHRHAMKRFADETPSSAAASGSHPPEMLPELDDAIAALSPRDRRLVIQRFFEGRSFREIAGIEGGSAEAGRKRLARALDRMAAFLARRGVTGAGTAAGVTALLSTELARTAPAGTALNILSAATASVASGGAGFGATSTATLVTFMKTSPIAIALTVATAASIPVSVRWQAHSRQVRTVAAARWPAENPAPDRAAVTTPRGSDFPHPRDIAKRGFDPEVFARELAAVDEPGDPTARLETLAYQMFQLTEAEVPMAAEVLLAAPNRSDVRTVIDSLFSRWAEFDPRGALAEAVDGAWGEDTPNARVEAARTWAATDPESAVRFAEELPSDDIVNDIIHVCVYREWARRDPAAAFTRMSAIPDPQKRIAYRGEILTHWIVADTDGAIEALAGIDDETERSRLISGSVERLAQADPSRGFALAISLDDPILRQSSIRYAFMQWSRSDPAAATTAFVDLPAADRGESLTHALKGWLEAFAVTPDDYLAMGRAWIETKPDAAARRIEAARWFPDDVRTRLSKELEAKPASSR